MPYFLSFNYLGKLHFEFLNMEIFLKPEAWIALLTLSFLEIVLGVDNIIFISIVSGKLPENQQAKARNIGLLMVKKTHFMKNI